MATIAATELSTQLDLLAKFKEKVIDDLLRYFNMEYTDALKTLETITQYDVNHKEYTKRCIEFAEKFDKEYKTIYLHVPEVRNEFKLSPTGYAILIYCLYRSYILKTVDTPDIHCNLTKCPFYRICIDGDVIDAHRPSAEFFKLAEIKLKESVSTTPSFVVSSSSSGGGSNNPGNNTTPFYTQNDLHVMAHTLRINSQIERLKKELCKYNCKSVKMTRRTNRSSNSFHIISENQFDMITAKNIILSIARTCKNNEGLIIDVTKMWTLPSGRSHAIFDYTRPTIKKKMSFEDFKLISIVDVWNKNNFYSYLHGSALENVLSTLSPAIQPSQTEHDEYLIAVNEQINEQISYRFSIDVNCEFFFKKFMHFNHFNFMNVNNDGIKISFDANILFKYITTENMDSETDRITHLEIIDTDEHEFYDIFDHTELTFKNNVKIYDILNINFENTKNDNFENVQLQLYDVNMDAVELKSAHQEYMEFMSNDIQVRLSTDSKHCMELLEKYAEQYIGPAQCIEKIISGFRRREDHLPEMIIYMYQIYCANMNVPMVCSVYFFNKFIKHFEYVFNLPVDRTEMTKIFSAYQPFTYTVNDANEFYLENMPEIVKIYEHIFEIMLNAGNITSVLCMFLNSEFFNTNQLICSIIAIFKIKNLTNRCKFILLSYISGHSEMHINTVAKNLKNLFERVDIIHFLANGFDQCVLNLRTQWYDIIRPFVPELCIGGGADGGGGGQQGRGNHAAIEDDPAAAAPPPRRAKKKKVDFQLERESPFVKLFSRYMVFLISNTSVYYLYESNAYALTELQVVKGGSGGYSLYNIVYSEYAVPMNDEPNSGSFWYRRKGGIFYSLTGTIEHHTPSFYSQINLLTPPELSNDQYNVYLNFDYQLKNLYLDTWLKAKHFIRYANYNKTQLCLTSSVLSLNENSNSEIQIISFDLNDKTLLVPDDIASYFKLLEPPPPSTNSNLMEKISTSSSAAASSSSSSSSLQQNINDEFNDNINNRDVQEIEKRNKRRRRLLCILNELYAIVCYMSKHGRVNLTTPGTFINEIFCEEYNNYLGICTQMDLNKREDEDQTYNYVDSSTDVLHASNSNIIDTPSETQFILHLKAALDRSKRDMDAKQLADSTQGNGRGPNGSDDTVLKLNTACGFENNLNRDSCNNIIIREAFNAQLDYSNYCNLSDIPPEEFRFILFVLSWLLRMGNSHSMIDSNFFRFMHEDRTELFDEFKGIIVEALGVMLTNKNLVQLATYLDVFCKNTTICADPEFTNIIMPPGYQLNDTGYSGKFRKDVFLSMASFMVQAQFNADTFLDITKMCSSFTHRGNALRVCYVFLGDGSTGKNIWIGSLCDLVATKLGQTFSNADLNDCEQTTGNVLARPLNGNLLCWFDEVLALGRPFKALVNVGRLTDREFYKKSKVTYQINSQIIVSCNGEPKINDNAAMMRVVLFQRDHQFVDFVRRMKLNRKDCVSDVQVASVTASLGLQLFLKKYPRSGQMNMDTIGNYLFMFNCADIFLNAFSTPISSRFSPTQRERNKKFRLAAHPGEYLLENKLVVVDTKNPMDIEVFDKLASEAIRTVSSMVNSSVPVHVALKEFKDKLKRFNVDGTKKIALRFVTN